MRIGITSTIPAEVVLAASHTLVDLNNAFIASPDPRALVEYAQKRGFPSSCCGWIRGIYSTVIRDKVVDAVIAVTGGDCSNTNALSETFSIEGIKILPFAYPHRRDRDSLAAELKAFCATLGVTLDDAEHQRRLLEPVRSQLDKLDNLLSTGRICAKDYHNIALSSSDFEGDPVAYMAKVSSALALAENSDYFNRGVKIALIGVPPIVTNLLELLDECGLCVVYDEIPRAFTMPYRDGDIVSQYLAYSYPYGMMARLEDIIAQCRARQVCGIIHYTQTFCFRAIEDIVLRRFCGLPVLTIEGDEPSLGDERLRLRLDSFAEMLTSKQRESAQK